MLCGGMLSSCDLQGLTELLDEGAVQLLRERDDSGGSAGGGGGGGASILAAVGQLQFEVEQ